MKTVLAAKEQFIVDASGQRVGVVLDMPTYEQLRETAEDNLDVRAYRAAKTRVAGEIARGDVPRIIGASPRTGQKVTGELLSQRLVLSSSPKGPLRLGFPADAAGYYFPNLYPAGAD